MHLYSAPFVRKILPGVYLNARENWNYFFPIVSFGSIENVQCNVLSSIISKVDISEARRTLRESTRKIGRTWFTEHDTEKWINSKKRYRRKYLNVLAFDIPLLPTFGSTFSILTFLKCTRDILKKEKKKQTYQPKYQMDDSSEREAAFLRDWLC